MSNCISFSSIGLLRVAAALLVGFVATTASAELRIPTDSRLQTIKDTKTIKIAYREDARPFSFLNDRKEIAGFSIDICNLVAKSIQQQLGLDDLKIELVPVSLQTRFSSVASGKADMECGSSTVTLGRMQEVDFSNYIFLESTGLLVRRSSNFHTFSDMAGKKIAVIAGTTNERAIVAQIKAQNLNATTVSVKDRDEGVAFVENGNADGFASDKLLLIGANIKNPDALIMLPDDLSVEPYAIVLPRGDWAFRLAVNSGLAQVFRNGQIVTLVGAWFARVGLYTGPVLRVMYGLGALSE
jgi:glutamate/aspartate transport system substrate-binding protein